MPLSPHVILWKGRHFYEPALNVFRVFLTINADYLWDLRVLQRRRDCCMLTGDTVYTGWIVWTFRRIPLSMTGSSVSSETSIHFSQYTRRHLPDDKSHLNSIHWLASSSKIKSLLRYDVVSIGKCRTFRRCLLSPSLRSKETKMSVSSCNGGVGWRLLWYVKWRRVVWRRGTNVSNMSPLPPFCDLHFPCY